MYVSAEWEVSEALQQFWTDIKPEANKQAQLLQTVHDADVGAHNLCPVDNLHPLNLPTSIKITYILPIYYGCRSIKNFNRD